LETITSLQTNLFLALLELAVEVLTQLHMVVQDKTVEILRLAFGLQKVVEVVMAPIQRRAETLVDLEVEEVALLEQLDLVTLLEDLQHNLAYLILAQLITWVTQVVGVIIDMDRMVQEVAAALVD